MTNSMENLARIVIVEQGGIVKSHLLDKDQYIIGRSGGANDISINSKIVSSQHGIITRINGNYFYNDLASTNGTIVNNKLLKGFNSSPSNTIMLNDADVLTIGSNDNDRVYILFSCGTNSNVDWNMLSLTAQREITIGRGNDNVIIIPNITVSRHHAVIRYANGAVTVSDLNSYNGTIVNYNTLRGTAPLNDTDIIKLGTSVIVRFGSYILYGTARAVQINDVASYQNNIQNKSLAVQNVDVCEFARQGGVQVKVENISRLVKCKNGTGIDGGNKKHILNGVSLTINPGELVAILGGSGAGKTTFMNCINGFEPATSGRVLINGTDLYKNYQTLKTQIGYVPQQDIVHDNLTLEDMLTYTGRLRLPKDVTKQEISQRVAEVLDMVDLTAQKDTFIKKLSGGQRKRASIAVELVSDPTLFFLDEPTSGLDPEAENNLMHRLKGLSRDKGKTVIVITHTLQNIRLFDKVIFLAPGGKLCFCGSPDAANKFFEVDNLADAYEKISQDVDGYVSRFSAYAKRGENE